MTAAQEALLAQGLALHQQGALDPAEALYRTLLAEDPRNFAATQLLGVVQNQKGNHAAAAGFLEAALRLQPRSGMAHLNLALALQNLHRPQEALSHFQLSLVFQPGNPEALLQRGLVLQELQRPEEALASFDALLKLQADPGPLLHFSRGNALTALRRPQEALASYELALELQPDHVASLINRGSALLDLKRLDEGLESLERALALAPQEAEAWAFLGNALHLLGRHREAVAAFEAALIRNPGHHLAHSNKIYVMDFLQETTWAEHQAERRRYFRMHLEPQLGPVQPHGNDRDPSRRLVVGYVSADFKHHSAAACFGPILRHHLKTDFQVICYSGVLKEDSWTQEFRDLADLWRPVQSLSDDALAQQIRLDGVDILVDLSGHSRGHRLGVFARRPAPVQITAWGHGGGTGLPMIDCQFTDPVILPAEARPLFGEPLVDLPCCITFELAALAPAVGPLPALGKGFPTFGGLNRFTKVSPRTLELWIRILQQVPGSHLLLKDALFDKPRQRARILGQFSYRGITPDRIDLRGFSSHQEHLATYNEVDLALDTLPLNGGISTWEALAMGAPVVTTLGDNLTSRLSAAILHSLGLSAWVAADDVGYVALAVAMAGNLEALAEFRRCIRETIAASASGNPERYTRCVESAYRDLWRRWVAQA